MFQRPNAPHSRHQHSPEIAVPMPLSAAITPLMVKQAIAQLTAGSRLLTMLELFIFSHPYPSIGLYTEHHQPDLRSSLKAQKAGGGVWYNLNAIILLPSKTKQWHGDFWRPVCPKWCGPITDLSSLPHLMPPRSLSACIRLWQQLARQAAIVVQHVDCPRATAIMGTFSVPFTWRARIP